MATPVLFEMYAGDDFALQITVKDADDNPIDITGHTFQTTIKKSPLDSDEDAPVKVDVVPDLPEQGSFYILLDHEQTRNLQGGKYLFDLQMVSPANAVRTLVKGKIKVIADITQRITNGGS